MKKLLKEMDPISWVLTTLIITVVIWFSIPRWSPFIGRVHLENVTIMELNDNEKESRVVLYDTKTGYIYKESWLGGDTYTKIKAVADVGDRIDIVYDDRLGSLSWNVKRVVKLEDN